MRERRVVKQVGVDLSKVRRDRPRVLSCHGENRRTAEHHDGIGKRLSAWRYRV